MASNFVHGSPLDEDEYVLSLSDARNVFPYLEANLVFFGHTHLQRIFWWANGRYGTLGRPDPWQPCVSLHVDRDGAYLVNPGSVGQPRDGDPRASWAIYDSDLREVALYRTAYNSEATRRKILAAGLPEILASRLGAGR